MCLFSIKITINKVFNCPIGMLDCSIRIREYQSFNTGDDITQKKL